MSRQCEDKLSCELCPLVHPTVLHSMNKAPTEENFKRPVSIGFVGTRELGDYNGA